MKNTTKSQSKNQELPDNSNLAPEKAISYTTVSAHLIFGGGSKSGDEHIEIKQNHFHTGVREAIRNHVMSAKFWCNYKEGKFPYRREDGKIIESSVSQAEYYLTPDQVIALNVSLLKLVKAQDAYQQDLMRATGVIPKVKSGEKKANSHLYIPEGLL